MPSKMFVPGDGPLERALARSVVRVGFNIFRPDKTGGYFVIPWHEKFVCPGCGEDHSHGTPFEASLEEESMMEEDDE